MLNHKIEEYVDKHIENIFPSKHDVITWLKNHERKNLLINNLTREMKNIVNETKVSLNENDINKLTFDFTKMFAEAAIDEKIKSFKKIPDIDKHIQELDSEIEIIE